MTFFEYKTKNQLKGTIDKGILSADDLDGAVERLKKSGVVIVEISQLRDFLNIRKFIYTMSTGLSKRMMCEFLAMLSFMLDAGLSLYETLINIRDTSVTRQLRLLAHNVAGHVRTGAGLSQGIRLTGHFKAFITEQIMAGEAAGDVPNALKRLSEQMKHELEFSSKIKSALIYPIIIIIVMVLVLWLLMTLVVPTLSQTIISMGGNLPLITQIVIKVSDFMANSTIYILAIGIMIFIAYKLALKNPNVSLKVDSIKLKIPIVGSMIQKIELSRFCYNLSALQESGITLVASLRICFAAVKNKSIAESIDKASRMVEMSGMDLSAALSRTGTFPKLMIQIISVGINSGRISEMLKRLSLEYENDVEVLLKRIATIIEPLTILLVGILAGTVVVSVFVPLLSVIESM